MVALTADRNTPEKDGKLFVHPVAAGAKIYAGSLVALNADGDAVPGSTATTLTAAGRAEEQVDNIGGSAGAVTVKVRKGLFRFANDADDPIDRADIGGEAYIVDDQTVAATDGEGTRSIAGKIEDVDDLGVWVRI